MESLIAVNNLSFSFWKKQILKDIFLEKLVAKLLTKYKDSKGGKDYLF